MPRYGADARVAPEAARSVHGVRNGTAASRKAPLQPSHISLQGRLSHECPGESRGPRRQRRVFSLAAAEVVDEGGSEALPFPNRHKPQQPDFGALPRRERLGHKEGRGGHSHAGEVELGSGRLYS